MPENNQEKIKSLLRELEQECQLLVNTANYWKSRAIGLQKTLADRAMDKLTKNRTNPRKK